MSLFSAIGKIGKAAIGTVMIPVDMARDFGGAINGEIGETRTERRARKVADNLREAVDEIDE